MGLAVFKMVPGERSRAWRALTALVTGLSFLTASCGGGDSGSSGSGNSGPPPTNVSVYTAPPTDAAHTLNANDVTGVVSRAVAEAQARGVAGTIAVTDRVGNVLAVYQMAGAASTVSIPPAPDGTSQGVQGVNIVPAAAAAIAKAVTGAYLSSGGNAFSTRTASQIVQEHFPPSPSAGPLPSGPLFGVQFSQLPCSDLNIRLAASSTMGPKRSPLGLAADPGGFPLYKDGVVVGGVGVITDGVYGFDANSQDTDAESANADEYVALAATQGLEAPEGIRANRISVGVFLIYSDAVYANLKTNNAGVALGSTGSYVAVPGYYTGGGPLGGTPYGVPASGYRPAGSEFAVADAYVLTQANGTNRFPATAAADGGATPLTQSEVTVLLEEAFKVLRRERAAIRQPSGSRSQVTISVVDRNGTVLGIVRSPDAPIFGTDVSLQKARTAAFFSSPTAASALNGAGFGSYVTAAQAFFGRSDAFAGWGFAFGDRSIGGISRPLFPDGQPGTTNGPFSVPIAKFSPFATGLQTDLIAGNLVTELTAPASQPATCSFSPRIGNGIQIFPGSVPIYRGNTLVGGIGVSGDGVTQDDMVAYLGLYNAGVRLGSGGVANAPLAIRSNTLSPAGAGGAFLQYVICPQGPFVDSSDQNVCPDVPNQ